MSHRIRQFTQILSIQNYFEEYSNRLRNPDESFQIFDTSTFHVLRDLDHTRRNQSLDTITII